MHRDVIEHPGLRSRPERIVVSRSQVQTRQSISSSVTLAPHNCDSQLRLAVSCRFKWRLFRSKRIRANIEIASSYFWC